MPILVVDDEVSITNALERGFTADGYDVDVAYDGIDGLRLARSGDYDAIILDIMLPGLDGHAVCRAIRSDGLTTPILMLTAKDTDAELADGLDLGADDYVIKPFSYVVLLSRVRALIRRSTADAVSDELLEVGDLRLDNACRTAHRGHTPLDLSPRAFAILRFLMVNSGRVVSKDAILHHVWDHTFDGDPNIVEVYISRLRRTVDTPFDRQSIQTVRGIGYRVVPS